MELLTFPDEAVASELIPNFVEARLHTDTKDDRFEDRILELQRDLAGTPALPFYIVLDPSSGEKLATGNYMSKERFIDFLKTARG